MLDYTEPKTIREYKGTDAAYMVAGKLVSVAMKSEQVPSTTQL